MDEKTTNQANNVLWFELRYGRITASKIYELSRCKKGDGVLVKQILGCRKIKLTSAMERGKLLEKDVSRTKSTPFETKLKCIKACGFKVLNSLNLPITRSMCILKLAIRLVSSTSSLVDFLFEKTLGGLTSLHTRFSNISLYF